LAGDGKKISSGSYPKAVPRLKKFKEKEFKQKWGNV
jgi:hypothetical protein